MALVDRVRIKLISGLRDTLDTHGPDWGGRETCSRIIEKLVNRESVKIRDPFYGDHMDTALHDLGIKPHDGTGRYETIREEIEKGEETPKEL